MADQTPKKGPNHSKPLNTKLPGIIKPGPKASNPKVKVTQAPPPAPKTN